MKQQDNNPLDELFASLAEPKAEAPSAAFLQDVETRLDALAQNAANHSPFGGSGRHWVQCLHLVPSSSGKGLKMDQCPQVQNKLHEKHNAFRVQKTPKLPPTI